MKRLIIVNGRPRSGKDLMIDNCILSLFKEHQVLSLKVSSIDKTKQIARMLGWDGEKTPENRVMLSSLKDFYTEHFDGPFNDIKRAVLDNPDGVTFSCVREPDEVQKLVEWCESEGIDFVTVLISGSRGEASHSSHSDRNVLNYSYDVTLVNNGSEGLFREGCEYFVEEYII